jgi:hypothetical protein
MKVNVNDKNWKSTVNKQMTQDFRSMGIDVEKVLIDDLSENINKGIILNLQYVSIKYCKRYKALKDYCEFKKGYEYVVKKSEYKGEEVYLVKSDMAVNYFTLEELEEHFFSLTDLRKQKLDKL